LLIRTEVKMHLRRFATTIRLRVCDSTARLPFCRSRVTNRTFSRHWTAHLFIQASKSTSSLQINQVFLDDAQFCSRCSKRCPGMWAPRQHGRCIRVYQHSLTSASVNNVPPRSGADWLQQHVVDTVAVWVRPRYWRFQTIGLYDAPNLVVLRVQSRGYWVSWCNSWRVLTSAEGWRIGTRLFAWTAGSLKRWYRVSTWTANHRLSKRLVGWLGFNGTFSTVPCLSENHTPESLARPIWICSMPYGGGVSVARLSERFVTVDMLNVSPATDWTA